MSHDEDTQSTIKTFLAEHPNSPLVKAEVALYEIEVAQADGYWGLPHILSFCRAMFAWAIEVQTEREKMGR